MVNAQFHLRRRKQVVFPVHVKGVDELVGRRVGDALEYAADVNLDTIPLPMLLNGTVPPENGIKPGEITRQAGRSTRLSKRRRLWFLGFAGAAGTRLHAT